MNRLMLVPFLVTLALLPAAAGADSPDRGPALRGAAFIRTTQQPDGGFGPPGQTIDAVWAIRSAGLDPVSFVVAGKTPADYLGANLAAVTAGPGIAAKAALGAQALGLDPRNLDGTNLLEIIQGFYDPATGSYGEDAFTQATAMLGLACSGFAVGNHAVAFLSSGQGADGGWGFGGFSDADTTALALQALLVSRVPETDQRVRAGIAYLVATQNGDGGWGYFGESNTSSTAFAIQGLIAAGEDPAGPGYRQAGGGPFDYLLAQQADDGSFSGFDRAFATNQALPALAGKTYCNVAQAPILGLPPAPGTAVTPTPLPPATGRGLDQGDKDPLRPAGLAVALIVAFFGAAVAATRAARR